MCAKGLLMKTSYRARGVNLEEPYAGVTTDAVQRASDTLRLHQW